MNRSRLAAALAVLIGAIPAPAAVALPPGPLPLGPADLSEHRAARALGPGATYTRIARGEPSPRDGWAVDAAFVADRAAAAPVAARLAELGFAARVRPAAARAPDDPASGPLGFLVRTRRFTSEADAQAARERLAGAGLESARVVFTGEDGRRTSGPWVVHVVEVEPPALERLDAELATGIVPGRELLSALAGRTGALAALNGGYFVIGSADGTPGDLAGVSVIDGALVSEAVNGRTSLLLSGRAPRRAGVAAVSTALAVRAADGAVRDVDGLNRAPALVRGCGGSGGDEPTEAPKHDVTCRDASELIRFTAAFGPTTEPGEGVEAALDPAGRVLELRAERGGAIPSGGSVLAGTGEAAAWLRDHAAPATTLTVIERVEADGAALAPDPTRDVVNGGPRLVARGATRITAAAEGFHWPESPEFFYRFGARRNPRTLVGVASDGTVLLVAVEGRRPGASVGASFAESARILGALGAREGLNLDGGGSTGLALGPALVSAPSDPTGERPIADAVVLRP